MMLPPMVLKVNIQNQGKRGFSLWIPLFVVVPFLLILFILVLPLLLLAAVLGILALVASGRGEQLPRFMFLAMVAVPSFFAILCALRGLLVDIEGKSENVYISVK